MYNRVRTEDNTSIDAHSRTFSYCIASPSSTPTGGTRAGYWRTMSDVVTPNFKAKSAAGDIIISPMTSKKHSFTSQNSGYGHSLSRSFCPTPPNDTIITDYSSSLLGRFLGPLPYGDGYAVPDLVPSGVRSAAVTLAATAAIADWKSASVQSMVFLAEFTKTVKTLLNPIKALTQEIARGRRKGFTMKGGLRGASGEYLTWFYGIRSLMFDIEGAQDALKAMSACKRERASGKVQESYTSTSSVDVFSGLTLKPATCKTDIRHDFKVSAGLIGDINFGVDADRGFGFRLSDIPGTLWELTPWSFVLDWGINLGDFIESLFTDTSTGVRGQWLITEEVVTVTRTMSTGLGITDPQWTVSTPCSDTDKGVYAMKTRSPTNLADLRGISIRTGLGRVPELAALALIVQQLTKR